MHAPYETRLRLRHAQTIGAVLGAIALLLRGGEVEAAKLNPPLPRPRPATAAPSTVGTAVPGMVGTAVAPDSDPACMERLASIANIQSAPPINGPGACQAESVVRLISVVTSDAEVIKMSPPALLRCGMAERFAYWLRLISAAAKQDTGDVLTGVSMATSFDCRGQNRNPNAKLSQHGLANAVDVQALMFNGGRTLTLTDPAVPVPLRQWVHESACRRFTTVLGPGSDGYHEDHIHVDSAERRSGYRICQWEVREKAK